VTVTVRPDQAAALIADGGLDFGDHPSIAVSDSGEGRLTLFVTSRQIERLQADGIAVEVGANLSARARDRASDIGIGDRFDGGRRAPTGLGRKIRRSGRGPR
jgi:hypothetical protein